MVFSIETGSRGAKANSCTDNDAEEHHCGPK